jgi:hypothetical protein
MKRCSRLIIAACGALLWTQVALASQATLVTPPAPLSMTGLASFLNAALLSIGSCNSGNAAPANGTGNVAFAGECWINTTANPWVFSYTPDGTHWVQFGALNTSTLVWTFTNGVATALMNANNLSDIGNAASAFANIVQPSGASTLGGVKSLTCSSHNWFNALSTSGAFGCVQPSFPDLTGSISSAQLSPTTNIYYPTCDLTGVADCSTNIQNAINSAQAAGGGTVQLPCTGTGQILINAGVTISNGGFWLRGCGSEELRGVVAGRGTTGTYINTTSVAACPITVASGANGTQISDLAFTQTQPAEPATVASFTGSISGTTLTVSSGTGIAVGQVVVASGFANPVLYNTTITGGSGTTWTVSKSQNTPSQAMATEGSLWTPTAYPPVICHPGGSAAFSSTGRLEVFRVLFAGVYNGIDSGTVGASAGQSIFTGRDYYHDIRSMVFSTTIEISAASDITRIEDLHEWPVFFPAYQTSPSIVAFRQANAQGILSQRDDNPMFNNLFFFGVQYGIRFNGANPDGDTQGAQITNLNCDSVHICAFADNTTGSPEFTAAISNLSFFGFNPSVCCDYAVQTFTNASNISLSVVNAQVGFTNAYAFNILGTGNTLTLTNVRSQLTNQANGGFTLLNVASGNTARVFGSVQSTTNNGTAVCGSNCSDIFNDPWTAYTPALTCAVSGTAPTTSAIAGRYKTSGKTTNVEITATLNSTGTCSAAGLNFSLPNASQSSAVLVGRENTTGPMVFGLIPASAVGAIMNRYDNSTMQTNGMSFALSGVYENQ